ncbi:hypothetical protein [Collimonas sp.]|nr:hypothetical protein [Collimonas sp.]HWW06145.1 hypothetical protein [Collimonas sp.]
MSQPAALIMTTAVPRQHFDLDNGMQLRLSFVIDGKSCLLIGT